MSEWFVCANSNAAPFFSDSSDYYVTARSAAQALVLAVKKYEHPCGLYALRIWRSADDYHKGKPWVAEHLSGRAKSATK
jgi:hypothetical protein